MNKPAPIRAPMALLLLTTALWTGGAGAVTIYRCGAAGNSYADTPCAGGRAFDADDARSAEQRAEARGVAALDRRLASDMQAERLRADAAPPSRAAGFGAGPTRPAARLVVLATDGRRSHIRRLAAKTRQRWIDDDREEFVAYAPSTAGKARGQR